MSSMLSARTFILGFVGFAMSAFLANPWSAMAQTTTEKAQLASTQSATQDASDEKDDQPQRVKTGVASDDPATATERQADGRRSVSVVASNRQARAILSNPFIPQTPTLRLKGASARGGVFGQILNMTCEADSNLLIDALSMNDKGERQMGTWRVKSDGSVVAEEVSQYASNDLSWVRRTPRYKFKDGSAIKANLPAGEAPFRRILDPMHDDIIYTSSKYSGEGHIYLGSIFSIWRQTSRGIAQRLVSWSPVNMNIEKFGYSYDMKGFNSGQAGALAVDSKGQIYISLLVDDAAYGANRINRTSIYRVDESKRKLVPVLDFDLEKAYAAGRQASDAAFGNRAGASLAYYEDGPLNKAFVGKVVLHKMCFDQNDNLYFLDNPKQSGGQVVRKIDLIKNEVTTWVY